MSSNGDGSAAAAMAANIQPGGGYGIYELGGDQKSVFSFVGGLIFMIWVDFRLNFYRLAIGIV